MKKIVITGALGYIGTELCKLYSGFSWKYEVVAIDNRFISERVNELKRRKIKFVQADILDLETIKPYIEKAEIVHHLAGITDVAYVKKETNHVTGVAQSLGGSGDPSPVTAFGVYIGMKASVKEKFNKNSLEGLKVSVQGLGHVGSHLVDYLIKDGAEVYVADIERKRVDNIVKKYGCIAVDKDEILNQVVDIYAPCALGATVNETSISRLNCKIIAGAANNVLKNAITDSELLVKKEILYAPDYVINAGGLINVANELEGYNKDKAFNQAEKIYDTLMSIFKRAKLESITTNQAAALQAEDRIKKISKSRNN